jgi:hypothetical protein
MRTLIKNSVLALTLSGSLLVSCQETKVVEPAFTPLPTKVETLDLPNEGMANSRVENQCVVKTIDRRNRSEAIQYFLEFCAIPKSSLRSPGHAFVIFRIQHPRMSIVNQGAFGMYPVNSNLQAAVGTVPGHIQNEATTGSLQRITSKLIVRVNSNQYNSAWNIRTRWQNANYKLLESDCVTFTSDVAASVPLTRPNRNVNLNAFPIEYINELIRINN